MNKASLIDTVAEKVGLSSKQTEEALNVFLDVITKTIKGGDEVTLTGFGTFSARTRKGRIGVNPRNPSEKIDIPAVVVPKFKAGKGLKDTLKKKESVA